MDVAVPALLILVASLFELASWALLVPLADSVSDRSLEALLQSPWLSWSTGILELAGAGTSQGAVAILTIGVVIAARTVALWIRVVRRIFVLRRSVRQIRALQVATLRRILGFGRQWFAANGPGGVQHQLQWAGTSIHLLRAAQNAVSDVVGILIKLGVMVALSIPLSVSMAIALPVIKLMMTRMTGRIGRVAAEEARVEPAIRDRLHDLLGSMPLVKAVGREDESATEYEGLQQSLDTLTVRRGTLSSVRWPLEELLVLLTVFAVQVVLILSDPDFQLGDLAVLAAFLLLVQQTLPHLQGLTNFATQVAEAAPKVFAVADFWSDSGKFMPPAGSRAFVGLDTAIELRGLTFGYSPGFPVLTDVSTRLDVGTHVAVVGETGSGKSTFAHLIARFHDIEPGRILVDGVDLRDLEAGSYAQKVALVAQESWILHRSLRENLLFGVDDHPTDEELLELLAEVGLELPGADADAEHEVLERPLGDRGAQLSGGQRQRIALIRALLRRPDVLILDEATSALDSRVERRVLDMVEARFRGRLLVTIAHRLSTIRSADRILVFSAGRLVESGGWDELLAREGEFARLHRAQFGPRIEADVGT